MHLAPGKGSVFLTSELDATFFWGGHCFRWLSPSFLRRDMVVGWWEPQGMDAVRMAISHRKTKNLTM